MHCASVADDVVADKVETSSLTLFTVAVLLFAVVPVAVVVAVINVDF